MISTKGCEDACLTAICRTAGMPILTTYKLMADSQRVNTENLSADGIELLLTVLFLFDAHVSLYHTVCHLTA